MDAAERLAAALVERYPDQAARVLEGFEPAEAVTALGLCSADVVAMALRRVVPPWAARCLSVMDAGRAAEVAARIPLSTAAAIIRRMEPGSAERLRGALPPEFGAPLEAVLRYPEGTAGALMDPLAFTLAADISVGEARRRVQDAASTVQYYLYVVDRDRKLAGVLNLREFILAGDDEIVASVARRDVASVPAASGLDRLANDARWLRYLSLPVVDAEGAFLGVLNHAAVHRAVGVDPRRPQRRAIETMLAMGELYWKGLSGLIAGAAREEPDHGREK